MIYHLDDPGQLQEAFDYLTKLAGREAKVEVKRIYPGRSLQQNNYLHLILTYLGMEIGEELEAVKTMYKMVNKDIYYQQHEIFGVKFKRPRSSADLTIEEMSQSIDRFHKFVAEHGYELPLAIDQEWLRKIHNDAEQSKYH